MNETEQQQGDRSGAREPLFRSTLAPELAVFLKDRPFACVTHGSDQGTILIVKAPYPDIRGIPEPVPIHLRYEFYEHPAAPVIRLVVRIYDRPNAPLALETFINVDDQQQRSDFAALADQPELYLLFYDEALRHRLTKRVGNLPAELVSQVLQEAAHLRDAIPRDRFDFDRAKAAVMARTTL